MHSVNIEIKPFNEIQNDTIQHSFMSDLKDAVTEISGLYFHYKEHKMVPITTRPLQTRSLVSPLCSWSAASPLACSICCGAPCRRAPAARSSL